MEETPEKLERAYKFAALRINGLFIVIFTLIVAILVLWLKCCGYAMDFPHGAVFRNIQFWTLFGVIAILVMVLNLSISYIVHIAPEENAEFWDRFFERTIDDSDDGDFDL